MPWTTWSRSHCYRAWLAKASTEHCYRACFIEVMLLSQFWCCRWTKSWSTGYWQLGLDTLRYPRYPGGNGKSWSTCSSSRYLVQLPTTHTAATEHDDPFNKLIKDIFANELTAEQKKKPHPSRRKNAASSTSSCEKIGWCSSRSLHTRAQHSYITGATSSPKSIANRPTTQKNGTPVTAAPGCTFIQAHWL